MKKRMFKKGIFLFHPVEELFSGVGVPKVHDCTKRRCPQIESQIKVEIE